jgi:glycosyltransferase involved in cell wall biosynthesis
MKNIVMLQGLGNNERGWARLVSNFGRVTLIQQGIIQHVETWEKEVKTFNGPETSVMKTRKLDEMTLSFLTLFRSIARSLEQAQGKKIDLLIAANYSCGMAALILRFIGRANKIVLTVSDYLPPRGSLAVRFHRRVTERLTRFVARRVDEVWTVSPRIPAASVNPKNFVFPICLDDNQVPAGSRDEIGYIGFPSPDHALEVLFEIARRHKIVVNVVGQSPYLESIRHLASPTTVFHGTISDPEKVNAIMSKCFCGYAVYRNTGPQSYSYYGIPSKTFYYFASNTPVVTTNTADFTPRIEEFGVGKVVEPKAEEIEKAILQVRDEFPKFSQAIGSFRTTWNNSAKKFHRERFTELGLL